ncbi:MAG: hypothetical protein K6T71_02285 [Candidatus Bipolaricaulota bacterium]|nr:hypothetical protein [Candidatus Bipolaricaulota bacterium]
MIEILIKAHSGVRWLVLALILIGIGRAGWGWLNSQNYAKLDRVWGAISSGLMDLQILLGFVIFFLLGWESRPSLLWHLTLMLTAAVSVHLGTIFARRLAEDRRKHYAHLLAYLIGLLLVLLGVYAVRGSLF